MKTDPVHPVDSRQAMWVTLRHLFVVVYARKPEASAYLPVSHVPSIRKPPMKGGSVFKRVVPIYREMELPGPCSGSGYDQTLTKRGLSWLVASSETPKNAGMGRAGGGGGGHDLKNGL